MSWKQGAMAGGGSRADLSASHFSLLVLPRIKLLKNVLSRNRIVKSMNCVTLKTNFDQ